jgi:hypothetical protein
MLKHDAPERHELESHIITKNFIAKNFTRKFRKCSHLDGMPCEDWRKLNKGPQRCPWDESLLKRDQDQESARAGERLIPLQRSRRNFLRLRRQCELPASNVAHTDVKYHGQPATVDSPRSRDARWLGYKHPQDLVNDRAHVMRSTMVSIGRI